MLGVGSDGCLSCCSFSAFLHFADSTMDLVLNVADSYVLTPYVYPASWPEDGALRQIIGLLVLTNLGAAVLYLGLGAISYFLIFDHKLKKHPHFLEVLIKAFISFVTHTG